MARVSTLKKKTSLKDPGRALMTSLLAAHLPDWRPVSGGHWPAGGLALWIRLPAPMSSALSAAASRIGVDLPPGPRFGVDGTLERYIRVPYTLPEDQMASAVELLARAWHSVTGDIARQPGNLVV